MNRDVWVYGGVLVACLAFFGVAVATYVAPVATASASATTWVLPGDPNRVDKPSFTNMPPASATAAASGDSAPSLLIDCDDGDLYKEQLDANGGDQKKAEAATLATVKKWSPECRWAAFESNCNTRCWDFETDRLIEGAASKDEARKIRAERLARNTKALAKTDAIVAKVRRIVKHATAIRSSPRGVNDACMPRMRKDFADIKALQEEVDDALGDIPAGLVGLKSTLSLAGSCLDCSDSRLMCDDMLEDMKSNDENVAEFRKGVEADKKALR